MSSPDKGEAIGRRGFEFAMKTFNTQSVDCFNYFLINEASHKFPRADISVSDMSVRHIEDVTTDSHNHCNQQELLGIELKESVLGKLNKIFKK